jgi:hypothetical protein
MATRLLYLVFLVSSFSAMAHGRDKNHCFVWPDLIKGEHYCSGVRVEGGAPCAEGTFRIGKNKKVECVANTNAHDHGKEESQDHATQIR